MSKKKNEFESQRKIFSFYMKISSPVHFRLFHFSWESTFIIFVSSFIFSISFNSTTWNHAPNYIRSMFILKLSTLWLLFSMFSIFHTILLHSNEEEGKRVGFYPHHQFRHELGAIEISKFFSISMNFTRTVNAILHMKKWILCEVFNRNLHFAS